MTPLRRFPSAIDFSDVFTVGAGYLDINAALADTSLVTKPALSPAVVYDSVLRKVVISATFR